MGRTENLRTNYVWEPNETGVTIIPQKLFAFCTNLQKVTLPEGLLQIGRLAFSGCENLTEVNLPSTLSLINDNAFFNCPFQP